MQCTMLKNEYSAGVTMTLFCMAGVTMTLFCTHGRVSGPSSLLDLEVMAPRGYSVPCQF